MPRLSIWNSGRKSKDYKFFDRTISEYFGASGTAVYCHMYLGVYDQANATANGTTVQAGGITSIQDPLLLENRDRAYDPIVYELRGIYNISDTDFDLRQFGLFLTNDTIFLELHLNDMVAICGRRLVPGDVVELPHQRDDTIPGDLPAVNKFYVVEDATRASDGYSATWYPHIWRLKLTPMPATQEYQDILSQQTQDPLGLDQGTLGDLISTIGNEMGINNAVVDAAKANFLNRYFETRQYWILPGSETTGEDPWVFAGDGVPPNGGTLLATGTNFPDNASVGDYYLRTDYSPSTLFRRIEGGWQVQEINWRNEWNAAHRLLVDFLNNETISTYKDGDQLPEKQALSKVVRPKADF